MCGIAGAFNYKTHRPVLENEMAAALKDIHHRGPDDRNFKIDGDFSSGMTRLSIIDLASPCAPFRSASGRFSIVFNGEIYNYRELRVRLEASGYRFTTSTDTEVIVALYDTGMPEPETLLRGMFGYAVFDHQSRKLFLVRDRLGKKPLFYVETDDGLVFGSEIKLLRRFSGVKLRPNIASIGNFLTLGYTPGLETAFDGVTQIPSAHRFVVDNKGPRAEIYWQPKIVPEAEKASIPRDKILNQIEEKLYESVKLRMVADVPVGIFLSGGIDSNLVLAFAKKTNPRWPIKAFTVGFEAKTEDETAVARESAKHFGVEHESVYLTPEIFKSIFSRAVYCSDNLLANPAMFANYLLSRVAGKQIKVALNGGGGDELFYGYPTYHADHLRSKIPALLSPLLGAASPLTNLLPPSHNGIGLQYKAKKFLEGASLEPGRAHYWWRTILTEEDKRRLFNDTSKLRDTYESYAEVYRRYPQADAFEQFALGDLEIWWREMGLYQADAMSMANSLELRVPMMDHHFVDFAFSLAKKDKFSSKRTKPLLRDVGARVLPEFLIDMKKKGFHVPLNEWFHGPLRTFVETKLSRDRVARLSFLSADEVTRLVETHMTKKEDNSFKLINLMVLVEWYHIFFLGEDAFVNDTAKGQT